MINEISIINSLGERLNCELAFPEKSGFAITELGGIEPFDADIKTTQLASGKGYAFNKVLNKSRTITIKIVFYQDNYEHLNIEQLRDKAYKYFKVGDNVKFYINSENRSCCTEGYVQKNKPTIFSNQCGCDIEIICPDPKMWYKNIGFTKTISHTWCSTTPIVYSGDFKTNFKIKIVFGASEYAHAAGIYISQSSGSDKILKIDTPASLDIRNGAYVEIDLGIYEFSVYLYRTVDGVLYKTDIIEYCDFTSENLRNGLPEFIPGKNLIYIGKNPEDTSSTNVSSNVEIYYPIIYSGV